MTENNKKILFTVLGVVLLILVGVGIGTGVYFLNKDKNENINDKGNITENEILKNAKSLNLSDNELEKISDELNEKIPFYTVYKLNYYDALVGKNIFDTPESRYEFAMYYIVEHELWNGKIENYLIHDSANDEMPGIMPSYIYSKVKEFFDIEDKQVETGSPYANGGGETGLKIKVIDKLYNSNTKEYFLKIEFVNEELGKKERSAILTFTEKNNQKLIKSFIYTCDYNDKNENINDKDNNDNNLTEDINNCKYYNDLAISDDLLKNKCENITKEGLKKEGFEELDFKSININSEMKTNYEEYDFSSQKYESVNALENNGSADIQAVKLILENNKAYYSFNNNKIEIKVDNVKSIYIHNAECTTVVNLYLLTTNGDVYKLDTKSYFEDIKLEELNQYANSFEKVAINQKFIKLKELHISNSGCGYGYDVLGITETGDKYSLNNNRKYDYIREIQLNEDNNEKYYVKSNREIEYKNEIVHTKIKLILGNLDEFFVSEDDYLYSLNNNSKVENSKIKSIYYMSDWDVERYIIEFENNNRLILMWQVDM